MAVDNALESPRSSSTDERYLVFERVDSQPGSRTEIWALPTFGERKPFPVIQNKQFDVRSPALSPDGKWLAYVSTETGQIEVYVVPFLHGSGRWQVSTNGATWPRWRSDGKELFYQATDNKIMSAEITEHGTSLAIGKVQALFQTNPPPSPGWTYDASGDGKRFVVITQARRKRRCH